MPILISSEYEKRSFRSSHGSASANALRSFGEDSDAIFMRDLATTLHMPDAFVSTGPNMQNEINSAMAKAFFTIRDEEGDNYADKIEVTADGFKIIGRNNTNQTRFLILHNDGTFEGYNGAGKNLGIVEQQFYDRRADIFSHFGVTLPALHAAKGLTLCIASNCFSTNARPNASPVN